MTSFVILMYINFFTTNAHKELKGQSRINYEFIGNSYFYHFFTTNDHKKFKGQSMINYEFIGNS